MRIFAPKTIPSKSPLPEQQLKEIFKQHDTNGDGQLNKAELKHAFQHLGALIDRWLAHRALHHADADGDGCISEKEMKDLVEYAAKFGYTIN